jgi:hypothetical protein
VEHAAEGQENSLGTPQGCSRRGDGAIKYFTISELGDCGGCQKTITPSSLRYEDQLVGKVRGGRGAGFSDI